MTDDTPSPVAETVDTSATVESDAVRKLALSVDPLIIAFVEEYRALAAERDAMRQAVEVNASLRTEITMILRAKDAAVAERDAAVAKAQEDIRAVLGAKGIET